MTQTDIRTDRPTNRDASHLKIWDIRSFLSPSRLMLLPPLKIWMKSKFICYSYVFLLYLLHEMSFFTIMINEFLFKMLKYTLKCGIILY